jgi:hypothetical protein
MASREQNEAMAGLLKRSLARDVASKGACPDPEMLATYFEHSLGADESKAFEVHLSQCAACREQLAAMARAEESLGGDRDESKVRRLWTMNWGWMTAAAAVAVLLAVWLVPKPGRMARMNQPAPAPLVAMNRSETASSNARAAAPPEMKRAEPSSAEGPANRYALAAKARALAKKVPATAGAVTPESVNVQPSENRSQTKGAQSADLAVPMKLAPGAAVTAGTARELREAPSRPQAVSGGQPFAMDNLGQNNQAQEIQAQANQSSQAATVAQSKQAERARIASAAAPMIPAAGSAEQANAPVEGYKTTENKAGSVPPVTTSLAEVTSAGGLQTIEQRASGKIINTPLPNVKWRFDIAGYVERSTDGGATWNGQLVDPAGGLLAGSAPNEKVCWVVGRSGLIYVTKNATTWTKINPPDSVELVDVSAKNASTATVKTADGRSFSTQDRGKKWKLETSAKDSTPR